MSGVVIDGQQWEHCNTCNKFIRFPEDLGYVKPDAKFIYGRMICLSCVNFELDQGLIEFEDVTPAPNWEEEYDN